LFQLSYKGNQIIFLSAIQESCFEQAGKELTQRFSLPDVITAFDDVRPVDLSDINQTHGIFQAAWDYLIDAIDNKRPDWCKPSGVGEEQIESMINDLVEKSIRNGSVREKLKNAITL
jgi:hypothetical protein